MGDDCIAALGAVQSMDNPDELRMVEAMAAEKAFTKGQISLAWMICKESFIVPIPGSRKEHRLRENIGAADVILSAEEISRIDTLLDRMKVPTFGGSPRAK